MFLPSAKLASADQTPFYPTAHDTVLTFLLQSVFLVKTSMISLASLYHPNSCLTPKPANEEASSIRMCYPIFILHPSKFSSCLSTFLCPVACYIQRVWEPGCRHLGLNGDQFSVSSTFFVGCSYWNIGIFIFWLICCFTLSFLLLNYSQFGNLTK